MENFVVSARKYRPSTFGTVVGQPTIVQTLKNAIRSNTLAQAFLFTGPRGIGKTTCARILAKTINCLNLQEDTEPCNECSSCVSFNQLASFNIQELDAASNNSVEDIRTLIEQVRIPPQAGKYKVYIIDEVHMLSQQAFNAFLKTLEEPPAYAKFILATTERHKILPTILSRCQIYDFKRITVMDIASHLTWVAQQEGITAEEEALHVIAQKADGAMRDALSIFDQIVSFSGKEISYANVISNLNLLDYEYYFRVMDGVASNQISSVLLILDEVLDKGFDGHHFVNGLGDHLRNLLLSKDVAVAGLLEVSDNVRARYTGQSAMFDLSYLVKALDVVTKGDLNYRLVTNKRLHLELILMQMCETHRQIEEKKKGDVDVSVSGLRVTDSGVKVGAQGDVSSAVQPPDPTRPATPPATPTPQPPNPTRPTTPPGTPTPQPPDPSRPATPPGTPTPQPPDPAPPTTPPGTPTPQPPDPAPPTTPPGTPTPQPPDPTKPTAPPVVPTPQPGEPSTPTRPTPPTEPSRAGTTHATTPTTGNGAGAARLSIKGLMEEGAPATAEEEEEDDSTPPEGETLTPLIQETVQALVNQYAANVADASPSFSTAITATPIAVTDSNAIVITFANRIAMDRNHLKELKSFLRQQITHTWFRIEAIVDEVSTPVKRILSPRDKMNQMVEQNPEMRDFITKLGLEPEE